MLIKIVFQKKEVSSQISDLYCHNILKQSASDLLDVLVRKYPLHKEPAGHWNLSCFGFFSVYTGSSKHLPPLEQATLNILTPVVPKFYILISNIYQIPPTLQQLNFQDPLIKNNIYHPKDSVLLLN